MKNPKNKFIIWVILLIVIILFSQIYRAYSSAGRDTNSYLSLIKGKATLNDGFIEVSQDYILEPGNIVRTIGNDSLAVIEWGDGSITRLWGNTKISVGNNEVSRDYTKINISFDLIAGKTWSNVISFISNDSSFTQTFQGVEAGVRGTIFDVDLEAGYIEVIDHKILLTGTDGQEYVIEEDTPFSLTDFDFIEFSEFLNTLKDANWAEVNSQLDAQKFTQLKNEIEKNLSSHNPFLFILEIFSPKYRFLYELDNGKDFQKLREILETLSEEQKLSVYTTVLSRYQSLNFISSGDTENYKTKLLYKRLLILLSDQKDKERLVETTLYDFKDTISLQDTVWFTKTMELLNENSDILKSIDTDFFKQDINLIPDDLENILKENFEGIQWFLEGGLPDTSDLNIESWKQVIDSATETFKDTKQKAEEGIQKWLESLFQWVAN